MLVCVLGRFRMLKEGRSLPAHGAKTRALICAVAVSPGQQAHRDALLQMLWPEKGTGRAAHSLNTLVYDLRKLLGDEILGGPVVYEDDYYRLNLEAGVGVDLVSFEALAGEGDERWDAGDLVGAVVSYTRATEFYQGDLCADVDIDVEAERQRLWSRYTTMLTKLAGYQWANGDYQVCLDSIERLLAADPIRDEAHRAAIYCYMRMSRRSEAIRHYRRCQKLFLQELDGEPEAATVELYDAVRASPDSFASFPQPELFHTWT